jgi:hypothetical protein
VIIQNLHATQNVYLGGAVVEEIGKKVKGTEAISGPASTVVTGCWHKSGTGNEWYFAKSDKTTSGMTQPAQLWYSLFAAAEGAETNAGSAETVGVLSAQHKWGWGDGDTLGFNTLYIRTDGSAVGNNPSEEYRVILGYSSLPANGTGYKLGPMDAIAMTVDSSCRVWAIADGATTTTTCVEVG